jgi:nicotinamide mononucleotide adenylyltransferase
MISPIAWVPAGVADPNETLRNEFTEQELIRMMQEKSSDAGETKNTKGLMAVKGASNWLHTLPADLRMDD